MTVLMTSQAGRVGYYACISLYDIGTATDVFSVQPGRGQALQALKKIHEEGRFRLDTLTGFNMMMRLQKPPAQVYVLYDYQARRGGLLSTSLLSLMRERCIPERALIEMPLVVDDATH